VQSVLDQTFPDFEIIVVIDGDDPETVAALGKIDDKRLRWISHTQKCGAGVARDTGVKAATGEWVAFLDDDDEWLPTKLERQLDAVAPGERAIVMAPSRCVSSHGTLIKPAEPYDERLPVDEWLFDRHTWYKGGETFLQTSSLMMPRELFDHLKFTDVAQHEEWELVIRATKLHGYRLISPVDPLVIFYVPENRKSLSQTYTWNRSLSWAHGLGPLLTQRAFSGFCLNTAAAMASAKSEREAFGPLLRAAFKNGAPTLKQLAAFFYFYCFPPNLRQRVRAILQAEKRDAPASSATGA
jgi:glycosyltransferase involved in cell wall biosynthesis